jgi:hypothetical protein
MALYDGIAATVEIDDNDVEFVAAGIATVPEALWLEAETAAGGTTHEVALTLAHNRAVSNASTAIFEAGLSLDSSRAMTAHPGAYARADTRRDNKPGRSDGTCYKSRH